jgi:hypothetical protein
MQWLSASDANFVQNSQLQNDEAVGSIPASDIRTIAEDEESQCQRRNSNDKCLRDSLGSS